LGQNRFSKNTITVDRWGFKYRDTLHFTQSEKSFIAEAINVSKIINVDGNVNYFDEYQTTPQKYFKIIVFEDNKVKATINIDKNCRVDLFRLEKNLNY